MPLINPTTTISLQFKPTKKMDNGLYTDPGFTFDLTKEKLFNKNPTNKDSKYTTSSPGAIDNQFIPTRTMDSKLHTDSGFTFNLTEETLSNFNPTNSEVLLKYTTSSPGAIGNQFIPELDLTKVNLKTFDLVKEQLQKENPTNPEVDLKYTATSQLAISNQFIPKDSPSNILLLKNPTNPPEKKSNWLDIFSLALHTDTQRQFWPMYYGTGDEQLDRELKEAATAAASILTNKALDLLPGDGNIMGAVNYLSQYVFRGDTIMVKPPMVASWDDITTGKDSIKNLYNDGRDLIKFFFTGPKVTPYAEKEQDDVMQFRAYITSLSDTHNPNWTAQQMVGRADPNYHYTGYSRDLSLDFTVYASSRLEMKPIWQKLNMLAGYTAPSYGEVAPVGPWMRITIGDLFVQQPAIISSLSYTLLDSDTTWEINLKNRDNMCELPHKVSVSIGFHLITDYLPQKGGQFYTLNTGRASTGSYWITPEFKQAENKPIIRKLTPSVTAGPLETKNITGRAYVTPEDLETENVKASKP
jgi:hypothetical protein